MLYSMTTTETVTLRHRDIHPGDWIGGGLFSDRHGAVKRIGGYRCSPYHYCDPQTCERSAWGTLTFVDGTEITIEPEDGIWIVTSHTPAS